jgi:hypothetical protein
MRKSSSSHAGKFTASVSVGGEPPEVGDGPVRLADILDHGWLELFYQPKIELKTKRLRTGEAARCRDPAPMAPATIHVAGAHGDC